MAYHAKVIMTVIRASKHTDKAEIDWLNEVLTKGFHELSGNSPRGSQYRFRALDNQLQTKLYERLPKRLKLKVDAKSYDMLAHDKQVIAGRQVLWIIYDDLKSPDPHGSLYYEDALRSLPDMDDNKVEKILDD